ncbi:hypothetical protein KZ779_04990 [Escherichia coli]|nr:hypothetical protein [Escherichia coli]
MILLVTSIFLYFNNIFKADNKKTRLSGFEIVVLFCGSHPLTHFVLPCQQLASAVKLFMQQTCTSPQWLAYFFLIKILPNMLAIVSCIGPPYFLLKRSNIHYSVRISTQASAFFVIVYRRAMNFNQ